jgi:Immunoglobulin I-set domain
MPTMNSPTAARRLWRGFAAVFATCLLAGLAACSNGSDDAAVPPATGTAVGTVKGQVLRSDTGAPVGDAKVSSGAATTRSAADGSFTLSGVAAAARATLKVEAAGYTDAFVVSSSVTNITTTAPDARLVNAATAVTFDASTAATVASPGSVAQVALPASSLVVESTGAAYTGSATAQVTPINPANDPQSMPGDYTASDNTLIESFGAIKVTLLDASGNKLNLKSGSEATIRIPLATRTASPPDTMPLYFFNESTGLWVQEGSATLQGSAPNQYYEGAVKHFSFWNVDKPLDTVYLEGCINNRDGTPAANASIFSGGVDYNGIGRTISGSDGRFRLPLRRNGVAAVYGESTTNRSNSVQVGPSAADLSDTTCLVLADVTVAPSVASQPQGQSANEGNFVFFRIVASGPGILRYQWQRNGVDIPGQTYTSLLLYPVVGSNAGTYTCVVSNAFGSVTSAGAVLTVNQPTPLPPAIVQAPTAVTSVEGGTATFTVGATGTGALSYQWQRNGVDIPGAASAAYTTGALQLADSGATYRVRVTNAVGSVQSAPVALTVLAGSAATAPAITVQVANVSVVAGQTGTFSVTANGTPSPSFQWFRNGVAIVGATGSTHTTPTLVVADNGATYRVVATNSVGSVTSRDATLTVTPSTVVGSTTDKVNLLRLLGLSFDLVQAGTFPGGYIADDDASFRGPGNFCSPGTVTGTFNGGAIPAAGTALPARGTLAATANNCVSDGLTFSGSSTFGYDLTSLNPANGNALIDINNMRVRTGAAPAVEDYTANGSASYTVRTTVAGNLETGEFTLTPNINATIRSELTGLTSAFVSGSVTFTVAERTDAIPGTLPIARIRVAYNQLVFNVSGQAYNANGFYESNFNTSGGLSSGSGEVVLSSGGVRVGRIYATAEGVFVEADGQVQAFKGSSKAYRLGR